MSHVRGMVLVAVVLGALSCRTASPAHPTSTAGPAANLTDLMPAFWDFFRTSRKDLPSRVAYYVGLRLVEQVGRRLTMDEMIRLEGPALRREIDRGLAELAAMAPPPPGAPSSSGR